MTNIEGKTWNDFGKRTGGPWTLYDELIEGIPSGIRVLDYCLGTDWSCVYAECGGGVSYTVQGGTRIRKARDLRGLELREVAEMAKSWTFPEATIGVAALNAFYAQKERPTMGNASFDEVGRERSNRSQDAFALYRPQIEAYGGDAKVVVIGHFPRVLDIAAYANLVVLERNCGNASDTPDPACEYVIPEADFLFTTGVTLINKTAPRILELSTSAKTIMVGPSATPAAPLFDRGVDCIAGRVVNDPERALFACRTGNRFGDSLQMFTLER